MLTVLFATHNGARWLPRVLEAFAALEAPAGGWKLIAVENASTDATAQVLESFVTRLPLTVLRAPAPGKNLALNLGLTQAAGDLVVLTDDDVLPAADWLVRLRAAADDNPAYDVFGGRIVPHFEIEPPDWLLRWTPLDMAYAVTRADHPAGPVSAGLVWGPNMMVRRAVFDAGNRFDEGVGPNGASYAMGSETEFTRRLARAGHGCWFCPQAVVEHLVRPEQMTMQWVFARAVRSGRGEYLYELTQGRHRGPKLAGVPRHLYRMLLAGFLERVRARFNPDPRRRFQARLAFSETRGKVMQARELAKMEVGARIAAGDDVPTSGKGGR